MAAQHRLVLLYCAIAIVMPYITNSAPLTQAPKVPIGLYYESLCPDCQLFIVKKLYPTFQKVGSIMDITLVPYGNAAEKQQAGGEWHFYCQHGPEECVGNIIETCAIEILGNISRYLPFVHCFEVNIAADLSRVAGIRGHSRIGKTPGSVAENCAKELDIDYDPINKCQSGTLGNKLEHEMATKTDALDPPHQYTPWVTLNGVHTEKIQDEAEDNLLKLVCDTYTGTKPEQCQSSLETESRHARPNRCMVNVRSEV